MAYNTPANLSYTKEHEWTLTAGDIVTVGITDFAQNSLGDIVFVDLPEVGTTLTKDQSFGTVESIKSVSDLYSPVSGEVVEINTALPDAPDLLNQDAYANWMIKIKLSNKSELESLLTSAAYAELIETH